jgi:hypothetical protein
MPHLSAVAASTQTPPFHSPLDTALAFTGGGAVFTVSGLLVFHEGRSERRRRLADDPERRPDRMRELRPLILAPVFFISGVFLLLIGLLSLLVLALHR